SSAKKSTPQRTASCGQTTPNCKRSSRGRRSGWERTDMAELILRKREAMHAAEIGLFVEPEVFEDDFRSIKMNADVEIKATQSRSLKQMRLAWGLARKVAMSGALPDADDAKDCMDFLKI